MINSLCDVDMTLAEKTLLRIRKFCFFSSNLSAKQASRAWERLTLMCFLQLSPLETNNPSAV
jgi:hypothetical protein